MKKPRYDISDIQEEWDILAAYDMHIAQLSEYHFRIDGHLDVWPTSRKAYDIISHRKWDFPSKSIHEFVLEVTRHVFNQDDESYA